MKITQILSAEGWKAVYKDKYSSPCLIEIPLVCWALLDTYGSTTVVGMEECKGNILLSPTKENFLGYKRGV